MAKPNSITTLPESPDDERRSRMIRYTVVMSIRLACILLMFVFRGWWILVPAFGAVALPYFAVVAANAVGARRGKITAVEPLGLPSTPPLDHADASDDASDGASDGASNPEGTP